jgi:hypothetical protein
MYWFTKIKYQDTERTYMIALSEVEAECCRGMLIKGGYGPDEVRVISALTLEEGVSGNGQHRKILSAAR